MKEDIKKICDLIIENRNALKDEMMWNMDSNTNALMAGFISAAKGIHCNPEKYKECKQILHDKAGLFSELRGFAECVVLTKMMNSDNPKEYLEGVSTIYDKLRNLHKYTSSPYMVMAAMNIFEHSGVEGADVYIEKLEKLYDTLNEKHPILINDADRSFLSLLAVSDIDIPVLAKNIEDAYKACSDMTLDKDSIHSMAQVMGLSKMSADEKAVFAKKILNSLKEKKVPISKQYALSPVGALTLVDADPDELIEDISDVYYYLKDKDGFKWYNADNDLLTMYSILVVLLYYSKEHSDIGTQISSNVAMTVSESLLLLFVVLTAYHV